MKICCVLCVQAHSLMSHWPFYSSLSAYSPHYGPERRTQASSQTSHPSTSSLFHNCNINKTTLIHFSTLSCQRYWKGGLKFQSLTLHQRHGLVWPFGNLSSKRCRTTHSWADQDKGFLLQRAFQIIFVMHRLWNPKQVVYIICKCKLW